MRAERKRDLKLSEREDGITILLSKTLAFFECVHLGKFEVHMNQTKANVVWRRRNCLMVF